MAKPIRFHMPTVDSREALRIKVEQAPVEHAGAVLAAYDFLGVLHDRGILDIATNALKASDEVLAKTVDTANTPQTIRALRNLLFWQKILGSIEPKWFQGLFQAIPDGLATATAERREPINMWRLLRRALSKDSLHGLAAAIDFVESFGRHLHTLEGSMQNATTKASRNGSK